MTRLKLSLVALLLCSGACPALAQIKVGVTVSATGPAASLGIPERNAITLAPKTIDGKTVEYIVLDDASDPTTARRNIERLTTEDKVDIVLGTSTTPASLAMLEVAGRTQTPMISFGAGRSIIDPVDDNRKWVFKTPYNDAATAAVTVKSMKSLGIKSLATISYNDAYGEGWVNAIVPIAEKNGITIAARELYSRNDTSVTAQILKIMSANPDAVLIVASGSPGALPQTTFVERGYKGKIYQTTGVVNNDFLRVGGKAVEGSLIAGDPVSVAAQLPDGHPAKPAAVAFTTKYDEAFGKGSANAFARYGWDAILMLQAVVPVAAKSAAPGTPQFRAALRDAIEASKSVPTTAGLVTMSPTDHNGYSVEAPVMLVVKDGQFTYAR
jgi:branched-chain amino acid transport system substrate-binding protein